MDNRSRKQKGQEISKFLNTPEEVFLVLNHIVSSPLFCESDTSYTRQKYIKRCQVRDFINGNGNVIASINAVSTKSHLKDCFQDYTQSTSNLNHIVCRVTPYRINQK